MFSLLLGLASKYFFAFYLTVICIIRFACSEISLPTNLQGYIVSRLGTAEAGGIMFTGCASLCSTLVNMMSQERLEGISSNFAQRSTWTQG